MKTSRVYTRVTGCKVAYMEKGQQNKPRFSHGWLRLRGSRTDSGNGSIMVGSGSGGAEQTQEMVQSWLAHTQGEHILQNNSLLALWLEVADETK